MFGRFLILTSCLFVIATVIVFVFLTCIVIVLVRVLGLLSFLLWWILLLILFVVFAVVSSYRGVVSETVMSFLTFHGIFYFIFWYGYCAYCTWGQCCIQYAPVITIPLHVCILNMESAYCSFFMWCTFTSLYDTYWHIWQPQPQQTKTNTDNKQLQKEKNNFYITTNNKKNKGRGIVVVVVSTYQMEYW